MISVLQGADMVTVCVKIPCRCQLTMLLTQSPAKLLTSPL